MASNASGRVRVVARIRGPSNKDAESLPLSKPWILVSRPDPDSSCRVKISFSSDQITSGKQSYEVDECYEEAVGNSEMFNKEIEPLVSGLFEGQNSTVFAFGPRGSGKTHTLQGSEEELGLSSLTMDSILPRAEEERKVVNVSVFEVCQDRITDLLDSKRSEVSVFEDAQGKIKLKGLSKVKVNSTAEFQKLYNDAANTRMQKAAEPSYRSHIGCIFHLVSPQTESSSAKLVGKINFIDLASYEDSRRKSSDGVNLAETTKIKKSLNAVHNVLYALNSNDRVPYRESKLTRMLQDSLGGSSRILMVTCMNPSFCQETVQTISVASRSCIAGFLAYLNPSKSGGKSASKITGKSSPQIMKSASKLSTRTAMVASSPQIMRSASKLSTRTATVACSPQIMKSASKLPTRKVVASSPQIMKSASKLPTRANLMSPKVLKPLIGSASARKHTTSLLSSGPATVQKKGRKLFVDINLAKTPKRENVHPVAVPDSCAKSEVNTQKNEIAVDFSILPEENSSTLTTCSDTDSSLLHSEKETSNVSSDVNSSQPLLEEDVIQAEESNVTPTPFALETPTTESDLVEDKENKLQLSPPLSARLRELSNNLKSLTISSEANLKMSQDSSTLINKVIHEDLEPKTPLPQPIAKAYEKYDNASPWTVTKDSLVQEYLRILNSANKEELKKIRGIGERRATSILELREESPEPFKELDDLKCLGLSKKQIKGLMKSVAGNLFA